MQDFENLGSFYLGREYDLPNRQGTDSLLLYDSRDLCTHAVVVGMTGSGKTGLCIGLLEEAGLDRIPSIVIDPKGDISNLLLTFPDLAAEDFRPWIDESQASRKGMTPDAYAAKEAEKWKSGLAGWGQDGERIRKLREAVEMRVYTPGSTAGRPMTILKSFSAPDQKVIDDSEALLDRVTAAASGLLALLGIDADPIRSREHILISKLLEHAWSQSQDMDLGKLITSIQNPPLERVGIMKLEAFFPKKDRLELAMTLNNLLASPSFSHWLEGEPMDIKQMLHTPEGKPCISIVSISHLNEQERMFFVTMLLNEIVCWMRSQAGTSSLRAILYMDEVFGYFPPTRNPPSKKPMLTLMKQARAYGLGCVLATQNPVDLDYKGLSNAGTWFLGRLQTERDKARVLEGLEGASVHAGSNFNRSQMEKTLAGLGSRVFLMNNVHDDEPVVFETRWVMSYLRGPLTRNQLRQLVQDNPGTQLDTSSSPTNQVTDSIRQQPPTAAVQTDRQRLIPEGVKQLIAAPLEPVSAGTAMLYRPTLLGRGRLHFVKSTCGVDKWEEQMFSAADLQGKLPNEIWDDAVRWNDTRFYESDFCEGSELADVPDDLQKDRNYKTWKKELKEFLYRSQRVEVWRCKELRKYSAVNESLGDFKVELEQVISEKRDAEIEKLRKKFAKKFSTLRNRIRRAEDRLEVEEEQYKQSRMSSILSVGSTLMGALLGRKAVSVTNTRRASSSMRSVGRASRQKADIGRAKDNLEDLMAQFEDLEQDFNQTLEEVGEKLTVDQLEIESISIPPRKSDITVEEFTVCWIPEVV